MEKKYGLGVALSGGGARGFAHAGALKAIEEAGLKPDIIAGVSAGSIIAVLYAAGVRPDDMTKVFSGAGFGKLTEFSIGGGGGLFKIDKFKKLLLKTIAPRKNFEDLDIPVVVGATDLDHGESVYFDNGPIGDRVMASCSIPILFKPVKIDGVNYVDGGVLRNLPAGVLRAKCERLIGLNVSPMHPFKNPKSVINVALRTYNLMAKHNQEADEALCDISVSMREISQYQVFNLKQISKVFTSGYLSTRKALREAGWWQTTPKEQ